MRIVLNILYIFKANPVTLYFDKSTIDREILDSSLDKAKIEVLAASLKCRSLRIRQQLS